MTQRSLSNETNNKDQQKHTFQSWIWELNIKRADMTHWWDHKGQKTRLIPSWTLWWWGCGPVSQCLCSTFWQLVAARGRAERRNTDAHWRELACLSAAKPSSASHRPLLPLRPHGDEQDSAWSSTWDPLIPQSPWPAGRAWTDKVPSGKTSFQRAGEQERCQALTEEFDLKAAPKRV